MYNTDLPARAELPSTGKLLRSTAVAALIAAVLLITTVLPAEYGIDPTGIGQVMGLTQMGKAKRALSAEALEQKKSASTQTPPVSVQTPAPAAPDKETASVQQHTMTVRLKPGQAAEIKITMRKDVSVRYEWTTQGGPVNYDTHGDAVNAPKGAYHGYGKGQNSTSDAGALKAAFDGTHGWFWRNRSGAEVTITLKTSGNYEQIKQVL